MKAMSQTLYITVAAIVILLTAVIVLVVFQSGITPAVGLTEAESLCQTQAAVSCSTYGQLPPTWNVQNINTNDGTKSCAQLVSGGCDDIVNPDAGGTTTGGSSSGTTNPGTLV